MPVLIDGTVDFLDLYVPSSGQFTQEDLRHLWDAGAELATWRKARLALPRDEGGFGRPRILGTADVIHDWRSLVACAEEAAALLAHWPSELRRRPAWLPVGVPAGSEDVPITAREAEQRGAVVDQDGTLTITQSARWVGHRHAMVSPTVASLADAVIGLVCQSVPPGELHRFRPVLDPLGAVAQQARAPSGHRDPDLSSWPLAFTSFTGSCIRAIAELQSVRRGTGVVPLLDTDELYEAWLAIQARDALDAQLGTQVEVTSDALAAWEAEDITFELWVKPGIPAAGRVFGHEIFRPVVAALLTPDLVLSATRDQETVLAVLDAKAWASMFPEDALTQSAKYLFGIRRTSDAEHTAAVSGVDLVTSALAPTLTDPDLAGVHVVNATPTNGAHLIPSVIESVLIRLNEALETREHLASMY